MSETKLRKLTRKEERFCKRYLVDCNQTKAAEAIGYSKRTARQIGYQLMTKLHIQARIKHLREEMEEKFDVTRENLIQSLFQIKDFDIRKLYDKAGNLKPIHTLDDDTAAALASIESDEIKEYDHVSQQIKIVGYTKKVKAHPKIQAIQELARILGYTGTLKLSGTDEKGKPVKEFKITMNIG